MLFSSASRLALAAIFALSLAACSGIRPVYGPDATAAIANHAFAYDEPASRLDQVIYNELRLRLGPNSAAPDAVHVSITGVSYSRGFTKTNVIKPATQFEMIASATLKVTAADGRVLFSGVRRATADYYTVSQVLADSAAVTEASERAGKALADTVRLTILSVLSRA